MRTEHRDGAEMKTKTVAIADVKFRKDVYPRIDTSAITVQKYKEDLDVLPPIEINQHNELIDGWHRWTAHKKDGRETIDAIVTDTRDDLHLLDLAIERNASFGLQLSRSDKMAMARFIYKRTPMEERGKAKQRLAKTLAMSHATISKWLSRIDKDEQEARDAAVMDLWLRCYTQQEIADSVGMPLMTTNDVCTRIQECEISYIPGIFTEDAPEESAADAVKTEWEEERKAKILEMNRDNAAHATDFAVPIYNVWKQQEKSEGSEHFGNSEVRWLDNLLYLYTNPFDIVVDPFAGGGSTLDMCRTRLRRCWLSDRLPIEERAHEIRELDLTESLPDLRKRWSDVRFVYLDPPYWKQAEGQYSEDSSDLANMDLAAFNKTLAGVVNGFAKKLTNAYIAMIIQPTQWKAPEREFTDHVGDMLRAVKLPVDMRYSVPYESQQCNAQMVEWAKANRTCLVLSREIVVWRVK
jgi:hypothetical protein